MSPTDSTEKPGDPGAGTLGGVLYPDRERARVPERDWVALVRAIAAGDQGALQALYERMHRVVYTLSARITGTRETAEEVTLDVFHDVWRRAGSYDPEAGTVIAWVMNLARSRAIDRARYEQRQKRATPGTEDPTTPVADTRDPHEALHVRESSRVLRDALDLLSEGEREAIETAFFSELTYAEAADRLSQPVGTVKTRIRSGLEKLRRALAARGTDS